MPQETENQIEQTHGPQEETSSAERCLTFESGGLLLFLSTSYITEIINAYTITPLPLVPAFIKGIINLRGQILPVVDIRLFLGKPEVEYTGKTCIVVLNVNSLSLGIAVDSVRQVADVNLQTVHPIPVKRRQKLLDGMVTMENGEVLMSFDCNALINYQY